MKAAQSENEIARLRLENERVEAKTRNESLLQLQALLADLQARNQEADRLRKDAEARGAELQRKLDELSATQQKLAQETKKSDDLRSALTQVSETVVPTIAADNPDFEAAKSLATAQQLGLRNTTDPLRLGASIGGGQGTGSICCVVQNQAGERFLLNLAFVVGEVGSPVIQPGPTDGKGRVIGTVARAGSNPYNSGVLIRLSKGVDIDLDGSRLGGIRGVSKQVRAGDRVRMIGRGSGLSEGTVLQTRDDDFIVNIDSQGGDAGAPVVNSRNQIVGILYASAAGGSKAAVLPIAPILQELGVTIVPSRPPASAQ